MRQQRRGKKRRREGRLMAVEIFIIFAIRFWPRIFGEEVERENIRENHKGDQGGAKYSLVALFHLQFRSKMQMVAIVLCSGMLFRCGEKRTRRET